MLRVTPIREEDASEEISEMYRQIKDTLQSSAVPVVFQYLAAFPEYFSFLWHQAYSSLNDKIFRTHADQIGEFGYLAMQTCYVPSRSVSQYLKEPSVSSQISMISTSVGAVYHAHTLLYLLSLAVRESLKGQYLGLKQIGWTLSETQQKDFFSFSEEIPDHTPDARQSSHLSHHHENLSQRHGVVVVPYKRFFSLMEKEMKTLMKTEAYLTRRVEMERFALAKLHLLRSPLDSSFVEVTRRSVDHPHFADLIYLLADVFSTEAPYKLLLSCVMQVALQGPSVRENTLSTELSE